MPASCRTILLGVLLPSLSILVGCVPGYDHANFSSEYGARQYKVQASDGASEDLFGYSVAIFGNTAIVGANRADGENGAADSGAAYVFVRQQDSWKQQAKLTAGDGKAGDTFGGNVAIWGDTAIVGSIRHDGNGEDSGAVYVFERNRSLWRQRSKVMAPDGTAGDAFGQSIAIHGDTMIVGAPHDDDSGDGSGSVYVFSRQGDYWRQQAKLTASDAAAGDLFGISVALTSDTILVGADLNDEKATNAGAAYVFARAGGRWVEQAKLTARDAAETDIFGVRVALSGDTALISARRDDDLERGIDAGSVYVFARSSGQWRQEAKLLAPRGDADDRFGRDVSLDKGIVLIGAMHQDGQGENTGAAHVFRRVGTSWKYVTKLTADDGKTGDLFGWSVAVSEGNFVVASAQNDTNGERSGAAYIYAAR